MVITISGCVAPKISFMSRCPSLENAVKHAKRTPENLSRDVYRHPQQTLEFFKVQPDMTVVEIWPGGGWYTEILAPYLYKCGTFYAASFDIDSVNTPEYRRNIHLRWAKKTESLPKVYGRTIVTELTPPESTVISPPGLADRVLTFRNVHNWIKDGYEQQVFESMFNALKPGGMLGVVEHRARPGTSIDDMIKSGYVTEGYIIELAQNAGFKLDQSSEINANRADSKDHPKGVWTLPPSLRLKEVDRGKYLAIGESDRMTLRFLKPE
ncbi:MAG: class I SAM-dependent methyltransferase [Gammaproteobacteria bacterium]|nr:class I SAM-dependent methyltransferase [Gammaproteobacteria bacterium]